MYRGNDRGSLAIIITKRLSKIPLCTVKKLDKIAYRMVEVLVSAIQEEYKMMAIL